MFVQGGLPGTLLREPWADQNLRRTLICEVVHAHPYSSSPTSHFPLSILVIKVQIGMAI